MSDSTRWVIQRELNEVARVLQSVGVPTAHPRWAHHSKQQAIFFGSHLPALLRPWPGRGHRIGVAYFHGRPGTPGEPAFDDAFDALRRRRNEIHAVQVTHAEMRDVVLSAGIPAERVHQIRIGINLSNFPLQTPESRQRARARFGIPETCAAVGSFQKDGEGWGDGLEPKLVKGPDILVETLDRLHHTHPEILAVICGPARGYVRRELDRRAVPYRAFEFADHADVASLYHALDAYVVTSRQEGGPKAILEAMATGVPIVSTRVGQAPDLITHGRTGWLADVDDTEALVASLEQSLGRSPADLGSPPARRVAEANAYDTQASAWRRLVRDLVVSSP